MMEKTSENRPVDASTVVLLCDRPSGPYEMFMMKRVKSNDLRSEVYVFPGGLLEKGDLDPDIEPFMGEFSGEDAKRLLQEPDISLVFALGLFMAAIRETFEEAGVLFARDAAGNLVDLSAADKASRFAVYRREIYEGRLSLVELARREMLVFAPDLLVPYSHWITPEIVNRRFNARFFLATLPSGQKPVHDNIELTDSCWMTPARALAEQMAGRILLMPPTLKTIEELGAFTDAGQLVASVRNRKIKAVLPEAFQTADGFGVRLPGDTEYSSAEKGQAADTKGTARIIIERGSWKPEKV